MGGGSAVLLWGLHACNGTGEVHFPVTWVFLSVVVPLAFPAAVLRLFTRLVGATAKRPLGVRGCWKRSAGDDVRGKFVRDGVCIGHGAEEKKELKGRGIRVDGGAASGDDMGWTFYLLLDAREGTWQLPS